MRDYGRRTTEFFSALNRDNLPLIDTFDPGKSAYEHLPVLGFIIRKVKRILKGVND